MDQELLMRGAVIFLLIFIVALYYFTLRVRSGKVPTLRRIQAFETLKGLSGRAIEAGGDLHLSLGSGSVVNETTSDSLAGLAVLNYVTEQAATTGVSPTISMADPVVMLLAQNMLRAAHAGNTERAEEAYRRIQWMAPQPAAYAAGVMGLLGTDKMEANVMVGSFGDEYLLIGEMAARQGIALVGGASNPDTLPFVYVSTQDALLGEEIYAAGAYLQNRPAYLASLVAQDTMRWLIGLLILGGIVVATLR
jgi:hypothetical protein